jgi:TPR repeat protein
MSNERAFKIAAQAYTSEDYDIAFPLMKQCAEQGHAKACFLLALMFLSAKGTPPDQEAYRYWLEKVEILAKDGDPSAQWELSCKYRWGNHFPTDIKKANYWLERAAESGNPDAQYHLAHYLRSGEFDWTPAPEQAEQWFQKALDQGHPEALYEQAMKRLALCNGQMDDEILKLLRRAASAGFSQAAEFLRKATH